LQNSESDRLPLTWEVLQAGGTRNRVPHPVFPCHGSLFPQGSCFWSGACRFQSFSEAALPRFCWSLSQVHHPSSSLKSPSQWPP
jgi:hypothetical protein